MFTLIIEDKHGALVGEYTFEDGEFILGRSQQADIQLSADNVSRRHARVFTEDGRCYIEDLKAANGVWVNGRRIHAVTELPRSAQVRIGDFFLHIEGAAFARPMVTPAYARLLPLPGSIGELTELSQPTVLIGRGKDCAIVLQDVSVSRIHAKITQDEGGRVFVEDLRSSNGTYVNDRRIDYHEVQQGDRVRFGTVAFAFQFEGMPEPDVASLAAASATATPRRSPSHIAPRMQAAFAPMEHPPQVGEAVPGRTLLPQIAAVAVILVALVALVVLVGFAYDRFVAPKLTVKSPAETAPRGPAAPAAEPPVTAGSQRQVALVQFEESMGRGRDAMLRKQWAEAKGWFQKARQADVSATDPVQALNKIALEERAGADIAHAEEAFKRQDFRSAIRYHKQVPASSVYGADAQKALQSLAELAEIERSKVCHGSQRDAGRCESWCEQVLSTGFASPATVDDCTKLAALNGKRR